MLSKRGGIVAAFCVLVGASCSSGAKSSETSSTSAPSVVAGQQFPAKRCAANRAAGRITYLSGFDFAASASIVDVLVAKQKGYFDALCLDVQVTSSDSASNHALVAAGSAQFASAGSFAELAEYDTANANAGLVALAVEGQSAIDTLVVKDGTAATVADLRGSTIGVYTAITPSVRAMLAKSGLVLGKDYQTENLPSSDPTTNITLPSISAFAAYQSNEPGQLDRAGIAYQTFAPASTGIPGTFGVLYTSRTFMTKNRSATEDFMRAAMQGLADAVADPNAASMIAIDFIDNGGNPNHLSSDGEKFRWQTESKVVSDNTPKNESLGVPQPAALKRCLDAYAAIGLFDGKAPDISKMYNTAIISSVYGTTNKVIWPTKTKAP